MSTNWLNQLGGILEQYRSNQSPPAPDQVNEHYDRVAQSAPPGALSQALASAFRSDQTPAFPEMLAGLFRQSDGQQRAGILNQLLASAGPLAASGLAERFSGLLKGGSVSPQQANEVSPEAVQQLAEHAQKSNPSIIEQASSYYAQHPKLVQGHGAGALALIMSHMSKRV